MRLFLISVLLVTLHAIARADQPPPLERGLRLYATQRYAEALVELRKGYEVDPQPDYLYAIGQAERMNGNCTAALGAYRAYLRTQPPELEASRARTQIERCEAQQAVPVVAPTPDFGVAGIAMSAGGVAAIGAGAYLLVLGGRRARAADDAYTLDERHSLERSARNFRIGGGVAIAGGIALGTLAVMRLLSRGDESTPTTVTASAGADHVYVGARLQF